MAYIGKIPAAAAITASDLDPAVITGQPALATSPADTDEFLISDAGVLKRLDASLIGGGKVLQVIQAVKRDTQSFSGSNAYQAITGLSLAITPSATSSKILITSTVHAHIADYAGGVSLYRGGSQVITHSESIGSRINVNSSTRTGDNNVISAMSFQYLDSPSSTSELTYQMYLYCRSSTYYLNRSSADTDNNDHARTISAITAMEIGA